MSDDVLRAVAAFMILLTVLVATLTIHEAGVRAGKESCPTVQEKGDD